MYLESSELYSIYIIYFDIIYYARMFYLIRIGLVARILRFHRGGRGSIPRCGTFFFIGQAV
jgi:hypothetical protein